MFTLLIPVGLMGSIGWMQVSSIRRSSAPSLASAITLALVTEMNYCSILFLFFYLLHIWLNLAADIAVQGSELQCIWLVIPVILPALWPYLMKVDTEMGTPQAASHSTNASRHMLPLEKMAFGHVEEVSPWCEGSRGHIWHSWHGQLQSSREASSRMWSDG